MKYKCRYCTEHLGVDTIHTIHAAAMRNVIDNAQDGRLTTIQNNSVCLLTLVEPKEEVK